jgi:ribosomal protein L40E
VSPGLPESPTGLPDSIARDLVAGYAASGFQSETILIILRRAWGIVMDQISVEHAIATTKRDAAVALVASLEALLAGAVPEAFLERHTGAPAAAAPAIASEHSPPPAVNEETMRQLVADVLAGPHALGVVGLLAKQISEIIGRGKVADVSAALGWLQRRGQARTVRGSKRWHAVAPPAATVVVDPVATAAAAAAAAQDDEDAEPDPEDHDDLAEPDEPPREPMAPPPCAHRWTEPGRTSLSNVCLDCGAHYGIGSDCRTTGNHRWGFANGEPLPVGEAVFAGLICLHCGATYGGASALPPAAVDLAAGHGPCGTSHLWSSNGVALLHQSVLTKTDICMQCNVTYGALLAAKASQESP